MTSPPAAHGLDGPIQDRPGPDGLRADSPATEPSSGRDADGRFTTVRSETLFEGAIFTVRADEITMPGGRVARREIVDNMRAVAIAALDNAGHLVLLEQYRHPLRRRLWELPAGLMDIAGEGPLTAAQRELVEEAGLAADRWDILVDLASSPGFCTETIRIFLARGLQEVPAPPRVDEEADMRIKRVPLATAVAAVLDGRIANAIAVTGILAAARVAEAGTQLRAAADSWDDGPATVNTAPTIGNAPSL